MERYEYLNGPPSPRMVAELAMRHDALVKQLADAQATIAALQARVKELEAIKTPDDAFTYCAYCGEKSPVDEHNEDLAAHIKGCPKHPMRDVESQLTQRTAELERVRGERDHAKKMEAVQKEVADNQTWHVQKLRTLILALPKVEGEILEQGDLAFVRYVHVDGPLPDIPRHDLIALLKHRQGME